jgi:hypothetical protein
MLREHRKDHQRLWTDLTTLARPGYRAAPATLLAFTAWQGGDGALANVALDQALDDDPDYSIAQLIRDALDAGAPPSMARLPMTPEDVAASYATGDHGAVQATGPTALPEAARDESTADGTGDNSEAADSAAEGIDAASPGALSGVSA